MAPPTPQSASDELVARDAKIERPQLPEDVYKFVCADIVDLGMRPSKYGEKQRVLIVFQADKLINKPGHPMHGKRYEIAQSYTLSLNESSYLSKFLERWRGKKFTDKERKGGWNLMRLIGACGRGQVVHNHVGEDTYANIDPMMKLPQEEWFEVSPDFVRAKDREQDKGHAVPRENRRVSSDGQLARDLEAEPLDNFKKSLEEGDDDLPF
jgi:hypothetical protein